MRERTPIQDGKDRHGIDEDDLLIRNRFNWDEVQPSTAAIEAVAAAVSEDPVALEQFSSVIDPDALDKLHVGNRSGQLHDIKTTFRYEGMLVSISSSGLVTVANHDVATT